MLHKNHAYGIVAALLVVGATHAFAWNDILGTIRSLDRGTREIVLDDGKSFPVVRGINLAKFKEGDRVVLHTETQKGKEFIMKMSKGDRFVAPVPKARSRTL